MYTGREKDSDTPEHPHQLKTGLCYEADFEVRFNRSLSAGIEKNPPQLSNHPDNPNQVKLADVSVVSYRLSLKFGRVEVGFCLEKSGLKQTGLMSKRLV